MFSHQGPARNARKNGILAGYLAFTAGVVNAIGFVLVGAFTSHVTGSIARIGEAMATKEWPVVFFAAWVVLLFLVGAVVASLIVEARWRRLSIGYGIALLLEAVLLSAVPVIACSPIRAADQILPMACLMSAAMGMQNSLVTQISGAVVRTTHLTGIFTDLGIEISRWLRFFVPSPDRKPASLQRTALLTVIIAAFLTGSVAGALLVSRFATLATLLPVGLLTLSACFALSASRRAADH